MTGDSWRFRWTYAGRLLRLFWELSPRDVALLAVGDVASGVVPAVRLYALQRLVDATAAVIAGTLPLATALLWLAAFFALSLTESLITSRHDFTDNAIERLKARIEERLIAKSSRLPLALFDRSDVFEMLRRAQNALDVRFFPVVDNLLVLPSSLVTAVGIFAYLAVAHVAFPIVLTVGLIPSWIVFARQYHRTYFLAREQTVGERMLSYLGRLMTDRGSAAEIRLFGLQDLLFARHRRTFRALRDQRLTLAADRQRALAIPALLEIAPTALVIVGIVAQVARGLLSVGQLAAYIVAIRQYTETAGGAIFSAAAADARLRHVKDFFDYLDLPEEAFECGVGTSPVLPDGQAYPTIRFEAVTFTYPGASRPVLDRIDLMLKPGERIALVGENGAGKSTLAKLLLGLYQPTAGRISADDVDLATLDPRQWRARVVAVFQDYVRYELTARENVGFGDLRRLGDDMAIHSAAARAGADAVIAALPRGLDTSLGNTYDDEGQDLSAGQWQKLAIARASLRDAAVLVLDEPTAALDARAEVEVYRQFRDAARGRSVLLISHRLGSARLADRIVVLDRGRVAEEGSHDQLLARGGIYARMFAAQAAWYR